MLGRNDVLRLQASEERTRLMGLIVRFRSTDELPLFDVEFNIDLWKCCLSPFHRADTGGREHFRGSVALCFGKEN